MDSWRRGPLTSVSRSTAAGGDGDPPREGSRGFRVGTRMVGVPFSVRQSLLSGTYRITPTYEAGVGKT